MLPHLSYFNVSKMTYFVLSATQSVYRVAREGLYIYVTTT